MFNRINIPHMTLPFKASNNNKGNFKTTAKAIEKIEKIERKCSAERAEERKKGQEADGHR